MIKTDPCYIQFLDILRRELVPALGCTEPIAIAYAAAVARSTADGEFPRRIVAECSGNIIKNVKSVIVPNSGGLRGIPAAAILGAVGGDPDKNLEVLESVTPADLETARALLQQDICEIGLLEGLPGLHIFLTLETENHRVTVKICDNHTNITQVIKDDKTILDIPYISKTSGIDYSALRMDHILDFANTADIEDLRPVIEPQVRCNLLIAEEGLREPYGAQIGRTLLENFGDAGVVTRIKAYAAAGSDARMSGCTLPVVINSGSGNQGITVSVPVVEYARHLGADDERLYRALALSNLTAIYQKAGIGRLSAYCGVVSAACGSGAAITYLKGGNLRQIEDTVINTLANISGIVCDGAKPSCAAKISSSLDAAVLGHSMAMQGKRFLGGEGIVKDTAHDTVLAVGQLGRDGMRETDLEILKIMIDEMP